MEKIDLKDTTFLIPIRLDSIARLENLQVVVQHLTTCFETHIIVYEANPYDTGILAKLLEGKARCIFEEDRDLIFHRTKYINRLVENSSTKYVGVWDSDIIVHPDQIVHALEILRAGKASFVFPYAIEFLDTTPILRELYMKNLDLRIFEQHQRKMTPLYGPEPIGGAFFANKADYRTIGLENEDFYGWGREDGERLHRWEIMGYKHLRVAGPLYHLTHPRGINSAFHSANQDQGKWNEILKIKSMSREELINVMRGRNAE